MKNAVLYGVLGGLILSLAILVSSYKTLEHTVEHWQDKNEILVAEMATVKDENNALLQFNKIENKGKFRITYYCNDCAICGTNNRTSDGTLLDETIQSIAVDSSIIPMGSIVVINGKLYVANDKGGAVKGKHIDIMVYGKTHEEVSAMGVDHYTVWVVK